VPQLIHDLLHHLCSLVAITAARWLVTHRKFLDGSFEQHTCLRAFLKSSAVQLIEAWRLQRNRDREWMSWIE
jgi:hypothetical protein